MPLIEWTQKRHNSREGHAGGIRLFAISWEGHKGYPGTPWLMWSDLPGLDGQRWRGADPEALQDDAEGILHTWLQRVSGG